MRVKMNFLILAASFYALSFVNGAQAEAVVGQPAPALVATQFDGKKFDLATLKGKVVIVHFWATWCAACREEMPALEAVWRQNHGKGLEVLAISGDRSRARGDVDQVMRSFSFPGAMLRDLDKNDFGTPVTVPVTYLIDKEGVVQKSMMPDVISLTEDGLADLVKNLLDAKPVDKKSTDAPKT